MTRVDQQKVSKSSKSLHPAEGSTLGLYRDLDQTRDRIIKTLSTHLKPLVPNFCLSPRPFRCSHWFSSYRLKTFTLPQPAIRVGGEIPQQLPG